MTARKQHVSWVALLVTALLLAAGAALAISSTEFDDFEDGTTEGWGHGMGTGGVSNIADGGPGGAGDNFLGVDAHGVSGKPGSRLVVFNEAQWTGDYNAVGAEFTISMQLANFGATPLSIRIGVENTPVTEGEGNQFVSTNAFALPADGVWREAIFVINDSEMTQVAGASTLATALDSVTQFRINSSASPAWEGDILSASLGIDDIQVVSVPVELQRFTIE